jgi:hypothetical protein
MTEAEASDLAEYFRSLGVSGKTECQSPLGTRDSKRNTAAAQTGLLRMPDRVQSVRRRANNAAARTANHALPH